MGHMYTHHEYREMGVGSALMENVLEDFPDVKVITSDSLVDMNRDIANKFINQGLSLKDSIKQTPAYKIREKFGYSEILPESIDPFMFSFSVKKPDLQSGRSH
jgi:GNAT superfamily N-acetyltransferase